MKFQEEKVSSKTEFEGVVVNLRVDQAKVLDGSIRRREVVEHNGGVFICAFTNDGKILLVKQFRYPISQELYELPAGKLEIGEDPFECAKRELEEETGHIAKEWEDLGFIHTSPGFSNEKLYVFKARDLVKTQMNLDDGEFLEPIELTKEEIFDMIKENKITDAKTICGVFKALND